MSAWFALTALGFHMMAPGSGVYHVNTPLFKRAEIQLSKQYHPRSISDILVIECDRDPEDNMYIHGIEVNGQTIDMAWLTWEEIAAGGIIKYHLSDSPDDSWVKTLPPSVSNESWK